MTTTQFLEEKAKSPKMKLTIKVITIGFIILILLIPKMMIMGVIEERETTANSAKQEVAEKWSYDQTVRGPVLTIPYIEKIFDNEGKLLKEEIHKYHFLPKNLTVEGEIFPKELHRSIYQSVVYETALQISGDFEKPDFAKLKIKPEDIQWDKAKLAIAINDLRGINSMVEINWNGKTYPFSPGMENKLIGENGISLDIPVEEGQNLPARFTINLDLKGSETLQFAPAAETTVVKLKSSWNDPGFQGLFLPTERNISKQGFDAYWKILSYNREFAQEWKDHEYQITSADFGVKLVIVADHYQKSTRSAKYGVLIILFVFLSFFLNEVITNQRIHPFQYILVGFAVLIFYLLLLSVSEHLGFNPAYLVSAILVSVMVLVYSRSFLKSWSNAAGLTSILAISFGFIYILLQLESYALLVGSIGLFVVLALTMFVTRKINWYE